MAGFRDTCCDICLDHVNIVIACSDKSSKFNSFACILVALDFHVFGDTNFALMNEGNIFLRVIIFAFSIQFAKFTKK